MSRFVTHLEGAIDGERLPADKLATVHKDRPILVRYDLPAVGKSLTKQTLQSRDLDEEKRREFYRIMLEDSDRLLQTIEQVLQAGSSGSRWRRISRTKLDLGDLAKECVELARTRFHLAPELLVYEQKVAPGASTVIGDADELKAAVWNLIDNAVFHREPGTRVSVRVRRSEAVLVDVENSGQLSRHVRKRLFRRFVTTRADKGGSGLGLAIVRAVAEAHVGTASCSEEGPPSVRFTLRLPPAWRTARDQLAEAVSEAVESPSTLTQAPENS